MPQFVMDKNLKILVMATSAISLGILSFWIWSPSKNPSDDFVQTTRSTGDSTSSRSFDEIPANTSLPRLDQERNPAEPISKNSPDGSLDLAGSTVRERGDLGFGSVNSRFQSKDVTLEPQGAGAGQNPSPLVREESSPGVALDAIATGGFSAASMAEIVQDVPDGAKVPALFYDNESKPIPQQKALDRIAIEFQQNVSEIPSGMTKEEVWEVARAIADERYITLFGYQAFNQYHLQSAKEALKEKRAQAGASGE